LKGRAFNDLDRADGPAVVIIDEKFAKRFWSHEDPIGKRLKPGGADSDSPWLSIVGVAGGVKHYRFNGEGRETVYFPFSQRPNRSMYIAARTTGSPAAFISAVRNQVWSIDPNQPVYEIKEMDQLVYGSTAQPRFSMTLLGLFAVTALILAS